LEILYRTETGKKILTEWSDGGHLPKTYSELVNAGLNVRIYRLHRDNTYGAAFGDFFRPKTKFNILINPGHFDRPPSELSLILAHEINHAVDLRKFKEKDQMQSRATEHKSFLRGVFLYSELNRIGMTPKPNSKDETPLFEDMRIYTNIWKGVFDKGMIDNLTTLNDRKFRRSYNRWYATWAGRQASEKRLYGTSALLALIDGIYGFDKKAKTTIEGFIKEAKQIDDPKPEWFYAELKKEELLKRGDLTPWFDDEENKVEYRDEKGNLVRYVIYRDGNAYTYDGRTKTLIKVERNKKYTNPWKIRQEKRKKSYEPLGWTSSHDGYVYYYDGYGKLIKKEKCLESYTPIGSNPEAETKPKTTTNAPETGGSSENNSNRENKPVKDPREKIINFFNKNKLP